MKSKIFLFFIFTFLLVSSAKASCDFYSPIAWDALSSCGSPIYYTYPSGCNSVIYAYVHVAEQDAGCQIGRPGAIGLMLMRSLPYGSIWTPYTGPYCDFPPSEVPALTTTTTLPPCEALPPTNLTAMTSGESTVTLNWTAPSDVSAGTTYTILRGTSSGSEAYLATGVVGTQYGDQTAIKGTTYYYEVRATTSNFISEPSNEVSVTPGSQTVLSFANFPVFGKVQMTKTSNQTVTLTNPGPAVVTLSDISFGDGTQYAVNEESANTTCADCMFLAPKACRPSGRHLTHYLFRPKN